MVLCDVAAVLSDRLVFFGFSAEQIAKVAQESFDGIVVAWWNGRVAFIVKPRNVCCFLVVVAVVVAAGKDVA